MTKMEIRERIEETAREAMDAAYFDRFHNHVDGNDFSDFVGRVLEDSDLDEYKDMSLEDVYKEWYEWYLEAAEEWFDENIENSH